MIYLVLFLISFNLNAKRSLTIWAMGFEGLKIKEMAEIFEKENPDIEVITQAIPWEAAHEKLMTAVVGDVVPDLCQLGTTWMAEFQAMGSLENLSSYLENSDVIKKDMFFKGSLDTCIFGDGIYGIPWYVDTRVLFYRKDILEKVGFNRAPETWDELKEVTLRIVKEFNKGLEKQRFYGILLPVKDWQSICLFLWQSGADLLKPESKEFKEGILFYKSLFDLNITPKQDIGIDLFQGFKKGIIPMFISGPWMVKIIKEQVPEIEGKWGVSILPGKVKRASFVGGCNWVIFRKSKNKDVAWKFIEFMTRKENQIRWFLITKDLPSNRYAWKDRIFEKYPKIKVFGKQLEEAVSPPNIPEWEKIATILEEKLEEMILGVKNVEEGLKELKKEIDKTFKERKKKHSLIYLLLIFFGIVILFYRIFSKKKEEEEPVVSIPYYIPYLFILPSVGLLFIFLFLPVVFSFLMSFTDWNVYSFGKFFNVGFVGLKNYIQLFKDKIFWKAMRNTFIFAGVGVPLTVIVALFMAVLLNEEFIKLRSFFRTSYFIPVVTTLVAVAVIWRWLYNPEYGLINWFLGLFKIPPQKWLSDPRLALPALILMSVWKNFGYNMVIFLAGLQAIPNNLYEAAKIDGASRWQQFVHITLPSLRPTMLFVVVMSFIGYFQFFAEPYIMTKGGPLNSTISVVLYMYNQGFRFFNFAYATSVAYVLFFVIFVFTLIQLKIRREE
ncbi:MAG: hypothetical protein DRI36_00520 [Caldiserica bacterium]|nr:MAG: hypothetical protein DRI36_00520 [Caldisericota bacterium]